MEQGQHVHDALFPVVREAPEVGAANEHGCGAKGEGLERVSPAAHPAVKVHFAAAPHGLHYFGERLDCGGDRVELAGAVVRNQDAVHAVLARHFRVFGGQHALDHNLHGGLGAHPRDVVPVERLVDQAGHVLGKPALLRRALVVRPADAREVAHGEVAWQLELVANVCLAPPEHGGVHRDR
eukprot:CAMPEP_0171616388 /NCGR_PEP_ID=MMETSP0990-20121206/13439_1 /TAXON_ID=483369 /ORGANISM="non described non described, Strain CCMP2098" /LENGTH=180 /DNA_ID=CAMNT_0012180627 /DNA_START=485 /DNA_END=1027 /DNA_ORIENTATION=-